MPDTSTDWQRTLDNMRVGNATQAGLVSDSARGARMLHAEFADTVKALTFTLSCWKHATARCTGRNAAVLQKTPPRCAK